MLKRTAKLSKRIKYLLILAVLVVGIILAVVGSSFHFRIDKDAATYVIKQVERHMMVPANEEPTVLTITDRSKVKSEFLKASETGDKVLIYERNQRAIIYRPSTDKIVDIVPVNVGDASQEKPRAAWPSAIE